MLCVSISINNLLLTVCTPNGGNGVWEFCTPGISAIPLTPLLNLDIGILRNEEGLQFNLLGLMYTFLFLSPSCFANSNVLPSIFEFFIQMNLVSRKYHVSLFQMCYLTFWIFSAAQKTSSLH